MLKLKMIKIHEVLITLRSSPTRLHQTSPACVKVQRSQHLVAIVNTSRGLVQVDQRYSGEKRVYVSCISGPTREVGRGRESKDLKTSRIHENQNSRDYRTQEHHEDEGANQLVHAPTSPASS